MSARSLLWVCLVLALAAFTPSSASAAAAIQGASPLQWAAAAAHTNSIGCLSEKKLATGSRRSRRRVGGAKAKFSIPGCSLNAGPEPSSARGSERRKAFTVRAARRSRKRSPSDRHCPPRKPKKSGQGC